MSRALKPQIILVVIAAAVMQCASAQAATVTIGSPLTANFSASQAFTNVPASWANIELPEAGAQPASPVSGTVVRWRVKGAFQGGPFSLQILRPSGGGAYTSVATSAPQTPSGESTQEFMTDLPIQTGDLIGLRTSNGTDRLGATLPTVGVNVFDWIPPLVDGGSPALPHSLLVEDELGFNADVEYTTAALPIGPPPVQPAAHCVVPKLAGKKLKAAKKALKKADCKLGTVTAKQGATTSSGKVKNQSPKAGKTLAPGSKVKVTLKP